MNHHVVRYEQSSFRQTAFPTNKGLISNESLILRRISGENFACQIPVIRGQLEEDNNSPTISANGSNPAIHCLPLIDSSGI